VLVAENGSKKSFRELYRIVFTGFDFLSLCPFLLPSSPFSTVFYHLPQFSLGVGLCLYRLIKIMDELECAQCLDVVFLVLLSLSLLSYPSTFLPNVLSLVSWRDSKQLASLGKMFGLGRLSKRTRVRGIGGNVSTCIFHHINLEICFASRSPQDCIGRIQSRVLLSPSLLSVYSLLSCWFALHA
jgi:hypothetical protein